jgi:hypothetical protein
MSVEREKIDLHVGDVVDCLHGGGNRAFSGVVANVDTGCGTVKTYEVAYDDGDRETGVARDMLFAVCVGTSIKAPLVSSDDNAFASSYTSGDNCSNDELPLPDLESIALPVDEVKSRNSLDKTSSNALGRSTGASFSIVSLSVNANVEARHGGQSTWYVGKVVTVNDDGSYSIVYEDGDSEPNVLRHRIRKVGEEERAVLAEGDMVDCRHGGGRQAFPGVIATADVTGSCYDVAYDDGDRETGITRDLIFGLCTRCEKKQTLTFGDGQGVGGDAHNTTANHSPLERAFTGARKKGATATPLSILSSLKASTTERRLGGGARIGSCPGSVSGVSTSSATNSSTSNILARLSKAAAGESSRLIPAAEEGGGGDPLNCLAKGETSVDFFKAMEQNLQKKKIIEPPVSGDPTNCLAEGETSVDFFKAMEQNLQKKILEPTPTEEPAATVDGRTQKEAEWRKRVHEGPGPGEGETVFL